MSISARCKLIILLGCLISVLIGCASVPVVRAWRPWVQTNRESKDIPLHSTFRVVVEGETQPLIGDERLRQVSVEGELGRLLERRGFVVSDSAADYTMSLKYKTSERESFSVSSWSDAALSQFQNAFSGAASSASNKNAMISTDDVSIGLAKSRSWSLAIAGAIAGQAMRATSGSRVSKKTKFLHVVAVEISGVSGNAFWKSDALWESETPDLSVNLTPALQTVLVDLPYDTTLIPHVPAVEESRAENFRRLYTDEKWFSCPALPYRVAFISSSAREHYYNADVTDPVRSPVALAAFVDLIQTAEFSVPQGAGKWTNPLNPNLWSKVTIGGRYRVLPDSTPVNILVKLKGNREGYRTDKCWIATDEEYADFLKKLSQWKQAVADHADVYKKL